MAIQCAGKCSPGPASYLLPQAIGPQPDSRKSRGPTFGFGTSLRFRIRDKEAKTDGRFGNNPSPAHYDPPPASVGPQVLGRFRSEPRMGFGTAERKELPVTLEIAADAAEDIVRLGVAAAQQKHHGA